MVARRAKHATSASMSSPERSTEEQYAKVVIVPPKGSAPASGTPSVLKFPLVLVLSLSLSSIANTAYYELDGPRLNAVSPDGNPQWQVYATLAWKVTEVAVGWFGGFDAVDVATLTLLTHAPHLLLLHTYYEVAFYGLAASFLINVASTYIPYYLLRRPAAFHLATTPDRITSDYTVTLLTTLFAALLYALPYLTLTSSGVLPTFLATHFDGLLTLELAHSSTLPSVTLALLPLGLSASKFFFVPAAHSLSAAGTTAYVTPYFDPRSATLGQTLHRNLLWHLYLPARAREALKRAVTATALTFAYTAFWAWVEVDGVEGLGALGWAAVWAAGTLSAGTAMAWVGGLADQ